MNNDLTLSETQLNRLLSDLVEDPKVVDANHLSDDEICWYVNNSLSSESLFKVEHHLDVCPRCNSLVDMLIKAEASLINQTQDQSITTNEAIQTIARGIRQWVSGWLDFTFEGLETCQIGLATPVLSDDSDERLPECLGLAIQSLELCGDDRLILKLNWLQGQPLVSPLIVVENCAQAASAETVWHRWQADLPKATQILTLSGFGLKSEQLVKAMDANQPVIAAHWDEGVLRLRLFPDAHFLS